MKRRIACLFALTLAACSSPPDDDDVGETTANVTSGIPGTVFNTGSDGLRVRAEPSLGAAVIGGLRDGQNVRVTCQARGDAVQGNDVWDYVGSGYVSDAFLWTGYDGFAPGIPRCGDNGGGGGSSNGGTGGGDQSVSVDIDGPWVRDHVQRFAELACGSVDACATSTYVGHQPSADLALDIRTSSVYGAADNYPFGDRLAQFALEHQSSHRIWYVIYRQRINYGNGWEWMEDRGSITQNHYDHVHVSFYQ
jgi:hypothetical protein